MEQLLARPAEVAEALKIARTNVYVLLRSGELPSVRIGRRSIRVPVAALRAWIAAHERVPHPAGPPSAEPARVTPPEVGA
jgi:excisionase family DNA binding protein